MGDVATKLTFRAKKIYHSTLSLNLNHMKSGLFSPLSLDGSQGARALSR